MLALKFSSHSRMQMHTHKIDLSSFWPTWHYWPVKEIIFTEHPCSGHSATCSEEHNLLKKACEHHSKMFCRKGKYFWDISWVRTSSLMKKEKERRKFNYYHCVVHAVGFLNYAVGFLNFTFSSDLWPNLFSNTLLCWSHWIAMFAAYTLREVARTMLMTFTTQ